MTDIAPVTRRMLLRAQRNEITAHTVYRWLAARADDVASREVFAGLATDERRHYEMWRQRTGLDVRPDRLRVWGFLLGTRLLGATFGMRLLERGEARAQVDYATIQQEVPEAEAVMREEADHERVLLTLLDRAFLASLDTTVLGLPGALVALAGLLAGLVAARQDARLVALCGLVAGLATAAGLAASVFLARRAAGRAGAWRWALSAGLIHVAVAAILAGPFLVLGDHRAGLALALGAGALVVALLAGYLSVARGGRFWRRFAEMAGSGLAAVVVCSGIGLAVRAWPGLPPGG